MDPLGAVSSTYTSLKALTEVLSGLAKLNLDTEVSLRVFDALRKATDVQQELLETQSAMFTLQSENQDLRRGIKERDDWELVKGKYKLIETVRGARVYESIDASPLHHACPRCFAKREIQILQDNVADTYDQSECPACHQNYAIKPERRRDPVRVVTDFDPFK